jgi:hypothetical protein
VQLLHSFESSERTCIATHIAKDSRLGGTHFDTRREQAFRYPVIAEVAFVGSLFFGVQIPGSIGAGLDAVAASDAPIFINENDAVLSHEGRSHRTHLNARRIVALIA